MRQRDILKKKEDERTIDEKAFLFIQKYKKKVAPGKRYKRYLDVNNYNYYYFINTIIKAYKRFVIVEGLSEQVFVESLDCFFNKNKTFNYSNFKKEVELIVKR